jgi:hypothetical protein
MARKPARRAMLAKIAGRENAVPALRSKSRPAIATSNAAAARDDFANAKECGRCRRQMVDEAWLSLPALAGPDAAVD